ncbi:MAG: tandem-95 repeat protein [Chloroflexota bacterium]
MSLILCITDIQAQPGSIDVGIGQTVFPDTPLLPSQPIVYTLFITNHSPITLSNIIVSGFLPSQILSTSVISTSNGSQIRQLNGYPTFRWEIDDLQPLTRVDIFIIGKVAEDLNEPTIIENVFEASAVGDTVPTNNTSSLESEISVPQISFDTGAIAVSESVGFIEVPVILEPVNPYGPSSVDYEIMVDPNMPGGSIPDDIRVVSGTLSFGAAVQHQSNIRIEVVEDLVDEEDEMFRLTLTNSRGASLSEHSDLLITIEDNDVAEVQVFPAFLSLNEGGSRQSYTVFLGSEPTAPVDVGIDPAPPLVALPTTLTFTPQTWNVAQTVEVLAVDDGIPNGVYTRTIQHAISSDDQMYDGLGGPPVTISVTDVRFVWTVTVIEDVAKEIILPEVSIGQPSTITLFGQGPSYGQLNEFSPVGTGFPATWSAWYTPELNFVGSDHFFVRIADTRGYSTVDEVHITVTPVNDAPMADPTRTYRTNEDEQLVVTTTFGLLSGSTSDPDEGDQLWASADAVTTLGVPILHQANGSFTYDPSAIDALQIYSHGTIITDTFAYTVTDLSNASNSAIVAITLEGRNDLPIAEADGAFILTKNTTLTQSVSLLINDTDIDRGERLHVESMPVTSPSSGSVVLRSNGTFSYTPMPDFTGIDSFIYRVCDDGTPILCTEATVTVQIAERPSESAMIYLPIISINYLNGRYDG